MIYVTSDLHCGEFWGDFADFEGESSDTVLILGDVGVLWEESEKSQAFLEKLTAKRCNIAFIDGNHENFDRLLAFPEKLWNGGIVHEIAHNIRHLTRGQIFEIEGKTFFTMGGSNSGEKSKSGGIWWETEYPTEKEFQIAYGRLKSVQGVDYVLTHTYFLPQHRASRDFSALDKNTLEQLFDYMDRNLRFRQWYFGHWHFDKVLDEKHTGVFNRLLQIM